MDEDYDVIVLGTGLTECVLSGLLSVGGKKVLHLDRNEYYGSESTSLKLSMLYNKYRPNEPPPKNMGRDNDWAIDLVPKFLMARGLLTNMLIHTQVIRYLEFNLIEGSFVYHNGRIAKVPATEREALRSPLMGIFEKRRMSKFLSWLVAYDVENPKTHGGIDPMTMTMEEVFHQFGLSKSTREFIGHAMALYSNDDYLREIAKPSMDRIILYANSVAQYGQSPYIYPLYGLGELPQAFARLSAIYGGTCMLGKKIDEVTSKQGKIYITSKGETVKADIVIGDPSYFPDRVVTAGQVVRAICIMNHPIPNTENVSSAQVIIPQAQINRKHDIYIAQISYKQNVAPKGYYLDIISTIVETNKPHCELEPAFDLLGPIFDRFIEVKDLKVPKDDGTESKMFISKSIDATSHFETVAEDVLSIYERAMGKPLNLKDELIRLGDPEE